MAESPAAICGTRNRYDSDDDDSTPASWIPQETLDAARDIDKPIIFMEGQTKGGEALLKAGAFPIGLQGLRLKLRTELASFEWQYRRVFLCLQPQGKKDRWLEIRAWILLRLAGAEVVPTGELAASGRQLEGISRNARSPRH